MNGAAWTQDEMETLKRLYPAASYATISRHLFRHPIASVKKKASTMGLRRDRKHHKSPYLFVRQLRNVRRKRGLTIQELSKIMGYHYVMVCRWETGQAHPSLMKLNDWCEALGCQLQVKEPNEQRTA